MANLINFSLNLSNIRALPFDKYDHNFLFIVNGKQYKTSRVVADLLSPIIRNYHYDDSTINEYSVNTNIKSDSKGSVNDDYFQEFLNLCDMSEAKIDEKRKKYFSQYFLQLGNIDEYMKLQTGNSNEISSENVIDLLAASIEKMQIMKQNESKQFEITFSGNFEKLIEFASAHFHEIDKKKLKNLSKNVIEEIISKKTLQIEEEDELLHFILELYKNDHKFYNFFEYIEFKNVSEKALENFIGSFSIDDLSQGTWQSICRRLLHSKSFQNDDQRYLNKIIEKNYDKSNEFDGIFKYLNEKAGGNVHDKGVVDISSNSLFAKSGFQPQNVVDYGKSNFYQASPIIENAKICFDFKSNKVNLSNYSIKTSLGGLHLKNWVIEASNDGESWEIIDAHENDPTLNKNGSIVTFNVQKSDSFYRFIQLRQTGKNWANSYGTAIYELEIYGKLMIK